MENSTPLIAHMPGVPTKRGGCPKHSNSVTASEGVHQFNRCGWVDCFSDELGNEILGVGGANPKIGWQQQILNLEVYLKSMELVREQIITALEDLRSSSVVECGISLCMYYNIPICILGSSLAAGSCP